MPDHQMRIAFIIINANRSEGTSRAVVEVAERLARSHEVHLFSRTAVDVDLSKIIWHPVLSTAWPDVLEFETFHTFCSMRIRDAQFDIVHSAGSNVFDADVYTIQTVHPRKMEMNLQIGRNRQVGRLRHFTRWLYDQRVLRSERLSYTSQCSKGVRGFLPVSRGTSDELTNCYPVATAEIAVIPNGADLLRFSPTTKELRTSVRERIGFSDHDFVSLFVGGEWHRKGLDLAISALARAKSTSLKLLVVGADPQEAFFRNLAIELKVVDRIIWHPFIKEIESIYSACDAFVFPSSYEAFSLATIEAAACGLPIVMSNVSGAAELLGNGAAGFIVDRDANVIASKLDLLESNVPMRMRMAEQARLLVSKSFCWDSIAAQTIEFYQRLLEKRRNVKL